MSGSDFWSRRRAAVAAEAEEAQREAHQAAQAAEAEALAERSDEEIFEELGVAPPEEMTSAEELRVFLGEALPQRLKTRALRRLWGLNPVLANLDGLVDYGEDFTDSALVVENLQTAYQVGKGIVARIAEEEDAGAEAQAVDAKHAADADPTAEAMPGANDESAAEPGADAPHNADAAHNEGPLPAEEAPAAPALAQTEWPEEPPAPLPASARRMRFSFEAAT